MPAQKSWMRISGGDVQSYGSIESHALFTDLYEVAMAQAYLAWGKTGTAVFETFFRALPPMRGYVVAAGLEPVVQHLETFRFTAEDIEYLRGLEMFSTSFLHELTQIRFTGDVWAVPEGTAVFPNEPIIQVIAPIVEAQLVETFVLNQIHFESLAATKAARVVHAAEGRAVVDFGSRRAHGIDAALSVARVSYLVGAAGTSNLLAGRTHGIPVFGTMAHSFVQAFDDELTAFEAFVRLYPETTLLVDTYDTLDGVDKVIALARRLGRRFDIRAVRLDSGDLLGLAKEARQRLDAASLPHVQLFASSGLDEHAIRDLLARAAPIDGFGVGTKMAVSADAPQLDMAYKLVEYEGRGKTKHSPGKEIYPGRKQVFRDIQEGRMRRDVVAAFDERPAGVPLLVPVMRAGRRLEPCPSLHMARAHWKQQVDQLPAGVPSLETPASYDVHMSERLARRQRTR
jgi:nicotinate phosphoribosyltransferase